MKFLIILLLASFCWPPHTMLKEKWLIEKESNLYFEGRTNISNFRCGITSYLRPDTLCFCREDASKAILGVKGGLSIDVNGFECQQSYMNKDVLKALKSKECPLMKISLLSIGNFTSNVPHVKGKVAISLAGVTRILDVDYTVQPIDDSNLRLYGKQQVLFSDFELTPPRKMAGLVKVEQQIDVNFMLALRLLK
ncbi:hypothetical protein A4D02_24645 [Niastella koreensis]|uniref:YceI family protein n=2 Tax=Niastella koreensis TaxID=354356 RepID=G8TET6_NIAKG|nr:hypothetical protein [Niastella koreensis]AEW00522.1 hypothetical protein Niako_4250 [Niastella koreensis GR20-10]OQP52382.1 hypothetical protein A4D02_24645 [Niastella koreensis]